MPMEGSFVWILLLGVGALTLLGALLIASERELKIKRREVEALLSKLEGLSEGLTAAGSALPETNHSAELHELRTTNERLRMEISQLHTQLANSEGQPRSSAASDAMSQAQIETEAEINA